MWRGMCHPSRRRARFRASQFLPWTGVLALAMDLAHQRNSMSCHRTCPVSTGQKDARVSLPYSLNRSQTVSAGFVFKAIFVFIGGLFCTSTGTTASPTLLTSSIELKVCNSLHRVNLTSMVAMFFPRHDRGPRLNGKYDHVSGLRASQR